MVEVSFTGTQFGMTVRQEDRLRHIMVSVVNARLHHGDCIGSDAQAHAIARELGREVAVHPPADDSRRAFCVGDVEFLPRPYLDRNKDIVDHGDVLLATPRSFVEELRSGTWSTIRYARNQGRAYVIIFPDGTVESHSARTVDITKARLAEVE